MPRFENQDSLERFLGNMKLQIFNAEFAELCKISPDSMRQLFDNSNQQFEKVTLSSQNKALQFLRTTRKSINLQRPSPELHNKSCSSQILDQY